LRDGCKQCEHVTSDELQLLSILEVVNFAQEAKLVPHGTVGRKAGIFIHADVCRRTAGHFVCGLRASKSQEFSGRVCPQIPLVTGYLSTYYSNLTTSHLMATALYYCEHTWRFGKQG